MRLTSSTIVRKILHVGAAGLAVSIWGQPAWAEDKSFNGLYVGSSFSWAWGRSAIRTSTTGDTWPVIGAVNLFKPYDFAEGTGSYLTGLHAGYNVRAQANVLVGLQVDALMPSTVGGSDSVNSPTAGIAKFSSDTAWQGAVRGRLGSFVDQNLLYVTGGWAWSWDRVTRTQIGPSHLVGGSAPGDTSTSYAFRSGWTAGAGIEVPLGKGWSAGMEYLFTDYGANTLQFENGAQRLTTTATEQSLRLAANYHFSAPGDEASKEVTAKLAALELQNWALHGQMTYVQQYVAPFRAPYQGANSLIPNQSRETWDATAYIGLRPWQGAELWVNPEIDQGFGLAESLGLAGFSSGAAYKTGSDFPYARLPRFFLRQTVNLGGKSENVEADLNQFSGTQTANRLVFTVGKFSASDIFDTNSIHDPRLGFLNWSLVDAGSWDYAADAWGFTYGTTVEWFTGAWRFAIGAFALSKTPNNTAIDTTLSQYQLQAEIQRKYELWGQPGSIAVTGFVSHGRMGLLEDATKIALSTGLPADISSVRFVHDRPGIAMNIEQQIAKNWTIFARTGISDGRYETFDFTDIDRTVAGGVVVNGALWGRPTDKVGLAGVVNGISKQEIQFLNAGGLGILVGDGKLAHPGTERILEAYYMFPLLGWQTTIDFQHFVNPAYNMDRGPVDILGVRLHYQF